MKPHRVLLLPGSVLPADLAYGPLLAALGSGSGSGSGSGPGSGSGSGSGSGPGSGPDVDAVAKGLELYEADEPSAGYTLDDEVAGVLREADERGWDTFHLVGYSGGGSAALAVTQRHPERLASLALLEPAWAGSWDWSPAHAALWAQFDELEGLPPQEFMAGFMRLGVKPGVVLPPAPAGPPPPWMAKRPEGIRAFLRTFRTYDLDRARLAAFDKPVYFALGGLSNPDEYREAATRLAKVFPDFQLEVFEDRHHFDPPHRIEPERLAASLRAVWERADQRLTPRTPAR